MTPWRTLLASSVALSEDTTLTLGLVGAVVVGALAWGETRFHVAAILAREKGRDEREKALEVRVAALEARAGRTDERVDHVLVLLTEVRADVKRLLERGGSREVA